MRKILVITSFLLVSSEGFTQKFLVLEKLGTRKRIEYQIGNQMNFRLKGEDFFRSGVITDLADSVIAFDYAFFSINRIEAVNLRDTNNRRLRPGPYPVTIMLAGVVLFLGDLFNETVIAGNDASLNKGVTITSGAMVGGGFLLMFIRNDIKKISRNWRLRVVDI